MYYILLNIQFTNTTRKSSMFQALKGLFQGVQLTFQQRRSLR